MSDAAAPAKAQKTGRSDTPHRGSFDPKAKGQNKRPQHNKGNQSTAALTRRSIDVCAQRGDIEGALALFRRAKTEGTSMQVHTYNVILHLCSGGNQQGEAATRVHPAETAEVFEHMQAKAVPPTEMTYTAMARVAAGEGDGVRAESLIADMRARGIAPKLRTFNPALQCYCDTGDIKRAVTLELEIRKAGISMSELEYTMMLEAMSRAPESNDEAWALLRRMKEDLRLVSSELFAAIKTWFTACCPDWKAEISTIDDDGACAADPSVRLLAVDLTEAEREELASSIALLSRARERAQDFDSFIEWSARHGPFDTIIDGANVGMFNQNFEDARFNFNQVEKMLAQLRSDRGPDAKPVLLVLHTRRVRGGPANSHNAVRLIQSWRANNELYTTPGGSNDDWYWLYAAVTAGPEGKLITNDELRDHVFQMLPAPRLFYKWKERHQVRFQITPAGVVLHHPAAFTTCIQEAGDSGWWMFPSSESDEWLCAKRLPAA